MPNTRKTFKASAILFGVLLFGLAGCSDKDSKPAQISSSPVQANQSTNVPEIAAQQTNKVTMAEIFPGATSNELVHIKACFDALDDGHEAFVMRHARELMDSADVEVRLQAVEAFGWIGRFAVNELTEMMADADTEVSSEAQRQWEMAFDEISSEVGRMNAIEKAAMKLKRQDMLEAVMMKLASLEDHNAVRVLCNIITSTNATPVAAEVARAEYASLVNEPFSNAKRAEQLVTELKNEAEGPAPVPPKRQPLKDATRSETK